MSAQVPPPDVVIETFLESRRAGHRSPDTIRGYRSFLRDMVRRNGGRWPETPREVDRYLAHFGSPVTAAKRLGALKTVYRWSPWHDVRDLDGVTVPVRRGFTPRVFTDVELRALLTACETLEERALYLVLLDTGIRIGELHSVRRLDLDLEGGTLGVDGKTGPRNVPISAAAGELLDELVEQSVRRGSIGPIWTRFDGMPLALSGLHKRWDRLRLRAGILPPKAGPHTVRHTVATRWLRQGGSVVHLQRLLGHTTLAMTQRYLHLADRDVAAEQERLTALNDLLPQGAAAAVGRRAHLRVIGA